MRLISGVFLALSTFAFGAPIACSSAPTRAPEVAKAKAVGGPFGALTLPKASRVVWILYRERWETSPVEGSDEGEPKGKGELELRRRDLISIDVLRPNDAGKVVVPTNVPLGARDIASGVELDRVHAIVISPGYSAIDWDSHAYESTPHPSESPPLVASALRAVPEGCDAIEGASSFFRDFPPGVKTGLEPRAFDRQAFPVIATLLGRIVERLDDPQDVSGYVAEGTDKEETKCEGYGERTHALREALVSLRGWVGARRDEPSTPDGAAPPSLLGLAADARYDAVIALWASGARAVPSIHAALSTDDHDARRAALVAAWGLERDGAAAIPDVLPLLASKDRGERGWAFATLPHLGTPKPDAVPTLIAVLRQGDAASDEVAYVMSALRSMGEGARSAGKPLVELAKTSADPEKKSLAMEALLALGRNADGALAEITELLRSDDATLSDGALSCLAQLGELAAPSVNTLSSMLQDADVKVRVRACRALAAMGKPAKQALPAIGKAISDGDPSVREAALSTVAALGPEATELLEQTRAALSDSSTSVRAQAARALGRMGSKASPAVNALAALLDDPDPATVEAAAGALGALGPASKGAVKKLAQALRAAKSEPSRRALASALIDIGPSATGEIPTIVEVLEKANAYYYATFVERMRTMGKGAAPHLGKLLTKKPDNVTRAAIVALGGIGKDASSEVPALIKFLADGPFVDYAFTSIGQIGTGSGAAVQPMMELLVKRSDRRYQCLRTLPKIGAASVAPMTKTMTDPTRDRDLRISLSRALLEDGAPAAGSTLAILSTLEELAANDYYFVQGFRNVGKAAVAPLAAALKDKRLGIKRKAAMALGYIGPDGAKDAIPELLRAMKDAELRTTAIDAIGTLGKGVAVPILKAIVDDKSKAALHDDAKVLLTKLG